MIRPLEMRQLLRGAVIALLWAIPGTASAGVIRGTVHVPVREDATVASMNAYPGRAGSMPGTRGVIRGLASDAVVYVERIPARAESALAASARATPRLAQKDQSFVPRVVAVAVGTSVDFPNQDPIYHNVFSLSPARRFDLGKYPRGSSRQVVFSKPGLVNVFCDIHSDMAAFVLVLPHHGFARPSPTGAFALPDLPAGSYVLRAWHPDLGEKTMTVEIPRSGDVTANVSF